MPHVPVLLKEVIEILNPNPGEFVIDGTIGSGGHAVQIFKRILPNGRLLGMDWDKQAIARLKIEKFKDSKNVILVHGNYANLPEILEEVRAKDPSIPLRASGLLLDLGFSSEQLENSKRGFSFMKDELLDMRYDQKEGMTAMDVVNRLSGKDLEKIFSEYGEERFSRRIAENIIEERKKKLIKTTFDLIEVIKKSVPWNYERGRIHPATRVFQALRIFVNQELENLETLLKNLDKIVKGRVVIISFHSLEDRLVKNHFQELKKQGKALILTKKPVTAGREEFFNNPRSRSAKLRACSIIST